MIPADVASRLQSSADAAQRPVAPTQELTDKLSDLVAGQKVMAEIQALLPNGTYRALINQRNITLALPFSAKTGDSLELQVTESDGKLALAVVSLQEGDSSKTAKEAVSATLSRTGQMISTLFAGAKDSNGGTAALALNGNQPIAQTPPNTAQDILPLLKQAITESGMFYESHQAEWVEGRFAKSALLQEPQGKLSSPTAFAQSNTPAIEAPSAGLQQTLTTSPPPPPSNTQPSLQELPSKQPAHPGLEPQSAAASSQQDQSKLSPPLANSSVAPENSTLTRSTSETPQTPSTGQLIAPQTQPIVQQQLEALATQNFVWQGQVWPGQEMRWEIEEDERTPSQNGDDTATSWRTHLNLTLPRLGGINAQLQLRGDQIIVAISADNAEARNLMQAESEIFRQQLGGAGLTLTSIGISEASLKDSDEAAPE